MPQCAAFGCDWLAEDGPLCRVHARRLEQGLGLPTMRDLRVVGEASGHGQWGLVDRSETGVLCHECGQRFFLLGVHLNRTHHTSSQVYRHRHGLPAGESLTMRGTSAEPRRRSHPCWRCGTVLTAPGKLCTECRVIRQREAEARRIAAEVPRQRRQRWRRLTDEERERLAAASLEELGAVIEALQLDRVTSAEIGSVLGHGPEWMTRWHPRPDWGRGSGRNLTSG